MSNVQKGLLFLIFSSFSLLFFQTIAMAKGKIVLKPRVTTAYQFDKNFWRVENDDKEAPVNTYLLQPGVMFGYKSAKSQIYLNYDLNAYWYDDIDSVKPGNQKASDDDYVGHRLNLAAGTRQINERLLLGLKEDFYLTRDQAHSDAFSDSYDRQKYMINRVEPLAFYDFSRKFTAGLRYRNTLTNYLESDLEDSSENRVLADLVYNSSPTASLNLDYQFWHRSYSQNTSDYDSHQAVLTFRKQYKNLSFDLGAGYQRRDFAKDFLESQNLFPWRGGIKLSTEPVQISPLYPDLSEPRSYVSLRVEHNLNDQSLGEDYFEAYRISLHAGHVFWKRITLGFHGYYQKSRYVFTEGLTPSGNLEKRDDDVYYCDLELGYIFTRWLKFTVNPGIEKRNSNLAGYGFCNPVIMANLTFTHNVGSDKPQNIE